MLHALFVIFFCLLGQHAHSKPTHCAQMMLPHPLGFHDQLLGREPDHVLGTENGTGLFFVSKILMSAQHNKEKIM
jgi:hypothetical protein